MQAALFGAGLRVWLLEVQGATGLCDMIQVGHFSAALR